MLTSNLSSIPNRRKAEETKVASIGQFPEQDLQTLLSKIVPLSDRREPLTSYIVGDIKRSINIPSYQGLRCIKAGVTAGTEPVYPNINEAVIDGSVVWQVIDIRPSDTVDKSSYIEDGLKVSSVIDLS